MLLLFPTVGYVSSMQGSDIEECWVSWVTGSKRGGFFLVTVTISKVYNGGGTSKATAWFNKVKSILLYELRVVGGKVCNF